MEPRRRRIGDIPLQSDSFSIDRTTVGGGWGRTAGGGYDFLRRGGGPPAIRGEMVRGSNRIERKVSRPATTLGERRSGYASGPYGHSTRDCANPEHTCWIRLFAPTHKPV